MIRKLTKHDDEIVMSFLGDEPSINLFIIGDLEAFGYETDFQELWGEFTNTGELKAVLLRFHQSFIPYAKGSFDIEKFGEIMKSYSPKPILSGKQEIVEQFESLLEIAPGRKQVTYFAECRTDYNLDTPQLPIQIARITDVDQIMELRSTIDEFSLNDSTRKMLIQAMETKTGRTYYLEESGKFIACASTTAENTMSAMIVGVCTYKNFRQRGLATEILQKMVKDVLNEGKILCLFYDNPAAGRIYKRLGFQDIGMWTMYR
ncbi:GNAT family N-acetyltransferase [Mesobacillus maritimus]|uniref:GNAT family N-acetyltransferase n=1 Tax=Mesobacillus maritimus TaxID=1643336 RepID=UPI00203A6B32|nr:GNAT family N-acetyltransferase [Mesobacillus maritimus]MCM3670357.1 GNAT family N-acetyltransferase [Mesobacillus maritimus]